MTLLFVPLLVPTERITARPVAVRVSRHITSSVSAPTAHHPNATQGGATPAPSATLINAKLEPQTAETSTKPGSQARDERASHRHSAGVRPGPAPYPGDSADRPSRRGSRRRRSARAPGPPGPRS